MDGKIVAGRPPFLTVRGLGKAFGATRAVEELSIEVGEGEFVCVLGPSGCGKTTLLRLVAGLEAPDSGTIFLGGSEITRLPPSRRSCGIVFQSYALFPNLTAAQNVAYGIRRKNPGRRRERVRELLELVDLVGEEHKYPAQLSGGQQQRVALARALAVEPALLLLDEPLSALDARVRARLRQEIRSLQRKVGVTTLMVTHDQEEALTMADRIVVMHRGKLRRFASPAELYRDPGDAFVAGFLGAMNFLPAWTVAGPSLLRAGEVLFHASDRRDPFPEGEGVCLGIRPEDLRVVPPGKGTGNVLAGTVRRMEYRGAIYRVRIRLDDAGTPFDGRCLDADLAPETVAKECVSEGASLHLHFPPERILLFGGAALEELLDTLLLAS